MIQVKMSMPEIMRNCKELISAPGKLMKYLKENLVKDLSRNLESLMEAEITLLLGNERYQRKSKVSQNRRNGHRLRRYAVRGLGELCLSMPRDRLGEYESKNNTQEE